METDLKEYDVVVDCYYPCTNGLVVTHIIPVGTPLNLATGMTTVSGRYILRIKARDEEEAYSVGLAEAANRYCRDLALQIEDLKKEIERKNSIIHTFESNSFLGSIRSLFSK